MSRRWTFETARALLDEVRGRTGRAVQAVATLERRLESLAEQAGPEAEERRRALALELRGRISRWVREMDALGVRVRGPWEVEFEGEGGAFCWAWPEPGLVRFRADEASEPTRIQ
jgi:hypothetical protein